MSDSKPLRFAALIRVSTEKQAAKGESLRTQRSQIEDSVAAVGGTLEKVYAGQEHATAGYERRQLDALLADAARSPRPFDAVMVADPSRWSRDNVANETGLEALRVAGVRFFVLATEYNLYDPTARFSLALHSTIGAFHAATQRKKSLDNRITRAKRGLPTCGKLPFGRAFDEATGTWGVDPVKRAMVEDVATRYLAGASLPALARKYGVNHANLCKILRERCGDRWEVEFRADDIKIRETVVIPVPRLLPEHTIRLVRARLEANRTYLHKPPRAVHQYLLHGRVFCAACGYAMFGQVNENGRRYYRHAHTERKRDCPLRPRPWVRADDLEEAVVGDLFDLRGNPAAIERAVKDAVPDADKAMKRRDAVETELAKVDKARNRILGLIAKDALTDGQAEGQLGELQKRDLALRAELDQLAEKLADVPDADEIRRYVMEIESSHGTAIVVTDELGNTYAGGNDVQSFIMMTGQDRRHLIESAFGTPMPGGEPAGVYVTPVGGARYGPKQFTYELRGRLIGRVMPCSSS